MLYAELKGGSFKACRFARDGRLGLFTVVNHQGRGHILYWSQSDLGELTLADQTKASCFSAPITAFDITAKGNFLGTGTSEGTQHGLHGLHGFTVSSVLQNS